MGKFEWAITVKAILNAEGSFYIGKLIEEQRNGLLLKANEKMIYVPYESVFVIEEIWDYIFP